MEQQTELNNRKSARAKFTQWLYYAIVISFTVGYLVYSLFFEPEIIGSSKWIWYFNILPIAGALVILGFLYRERLAKFLASERKRQEKIIAFMLLIPGASIVLYVFVGFPANFIFDQANLHYSKKSPVQTEICAIEEFHKKRGKRSSNSIKFKYDGHREAFGVGADLIKQYESRNPADYNLQIEVRKGMLDTFVVEAWEIVPKRNLPK